MVVIVIIGILLAIALPNFVSAQDRAKISSMKSNMRIVQSAMEIYSIDWGGTYPSVINNRYLREAGAIGAANAHRLAYWKEFANPFTLEEGLNKSFRNAKIKARHTRSNNQKALNNSTGMVIFDRETASNSGNSQYALYGSGKQNILTRYRGNIYVLTNG